MIEIHDRVRFANAVRHARRFHNVGAGVVGSLPYSRQSSAPEAYAEVRSRMDEIVVAATCISLAAELFCKAVLAGAAGPGADSRGWRGTTSGSCSQRSRKSWS